MRSKLLGACLILSCGQVQDPVCYSAAWSVGYTNYPRNVTYTSTAFGNGVSDPNSQIDPAKLDRTMANTVDCVRRVWPTLTTQQKHDAWCSAGGTVSIEIKSCLTIVVPSDWYTSQCTGAQVFPCDVPTQSCTNKGQDPDSGCACACRAITQGTDTIVTAPNMELLPAQLTQLMTGCDQIWGSPLAECGNPALVAAEAVK